MARGTWFPPVSFLARRRASVPSSRRFSVRSSWSTVIHFHQTRARGLLVGLARSRGRPRRSTPASLHHRRGRASPRAASPATTCRARRSPLQRPSRASASASSSATPKRWPTPSAARRSRPSDARSRRPRKRASPPWRLRTRRPRLARHRGHIFGTCVVAVAASPRARACTLVRAIDRQTRSNREHPEPNAPGSRSRSSTVTWITLAGRRNRRARRPPRPRRAPSPADADAILSILPPWVGFLTPLFFFVPLLFSSSPSRRRLFSEVDDDDGDVILGSEPDGALDERVRELIRAHVRVLLRLLLDERRALGGVDRVP